MLFPTVPQYQFLPDINEERNSPDDDCCENSAACLLHLHAPTVAALCFPLLPRNRVFPEKILTNFWEKVAAGQECTSGVGEARSLSIKQIISQTDWDDLTPRLVLYARSRMAKMVWGAHHDQESIKGMMPSDFVHDAILKTLSGRRSWDYQNKPLANHLMDVIKSDISNLVNSRENLITSIISDNELFHLAMEWDTEYEFAKKELIEKFFAFIRERDPKILYTARSVYQFDEKNPGQIAQDKGIDLAQVKKDMRRLYRITE